MINDLFAGLCEYLLISDADYSNYYLVFNHLYDNGFYTYLGLITFLVVLLPLILFYKAYQNPYAGIGHWIIALIIGGVLTGILIHFTLDWAIFEVHYPILMSALSNQNTGYADFVDSFMLIQPIKCAMLAMLLGALYSLGLKSISKIHTHLPI